MLGAIQLGGGGGGILANKTFLFNSDKQAVVSILNTNTSRSPEIKILVGRLVLKYL